MTKKQKFILPDGKGGGDIYCFEISANPSQPDSPVNQHIWFDSVNRCIKMFNADTGKWENFEVSTPDIPDNPVNNQIWFDVNNRSIKIYNSVTNQWENFEIADVDEPENPVNNQVWTDVTDKSIKIYNSETNQWEIFVAKPVSTAITIPTSGWVLDSAETSDYKYYYEISVPDLKPVDIVEIFYSRQSIETVLEAGVCPSDNESSAGKFKIKIPTAPINATYVVWKG